MRVFLAGATGAVGCLLTPMLRAAGHNVFGTTRRAERAAALERAGATAVVVDAFDAPALTRAVEAARPDVVIHQLTDLPQSLDPQTYAAALARNSRLRIEATPNLAAAARAAGAKRLIAQSVAFAYAPGNEPHDEACPLDAAESRRALVEGVMALESAVTRNSDIASIVLRYGFFYGPGTWYSTAERRPALHVAAAAHAALLAVTNGVAGLYNIAEDDGVVSIAKARQQLGFDPAYRSG